jgi:signal transduction histidine kinase
LVLDTFAGPLGQVITNLVNNAILHGFDGRQDGEMRLSAAMLDADHVRIRFSDNGVGISASDAVHVMEPFFTTKMGQGGTGLGLSIVHNIVTGPLGGTMELASELGKGTTFTLVLPRVALSSSAPQELAPRSALA